MTITQRRFLVECTDAAPVILMASTFYDAIRVYELRLEAEHGRALPDECAIVVTDHATDEARGYVNPDGFWTRDDDAIEAF